MAFRRYSKIHSKALNSLRIKARTNNLAPTDIEPYLSNKAVDNPVSKYFNAYKLSDRQRFTLKAYGKPFNYQGVMTKRYDMAALLKLFFVNRRTLYDWMEKGYLPEPMFKIVQKPIRVFWLYHQIQPFYVWYWHLRARGLKTASVTTKDYQLLLRMLISQERRWYRMLGIEYHDPYRRTAGKYGVIYPVEKLQNRLST